MAELAEEVPGALEQGGRIEVNGRKARTFVAPEKAPLALRHPNGRLAGRFVSQ